MTKYIVVGSGRMGQAVVHHLCKTEPSSRVFMVDNDYDALLVSYSKIWDMGHRNVQMHYVNSLKGITVLSDAQNCVVIACCGYKTYEELTAICINAKMHMVDLGGNRTVVGNQKDMHQSAVSSNLTIIPDCGLAPGLINILGMDLYKKSSGESDINIDLSVGGLPQLHTIHDDSPLKYSLVWSANGLINEYDEPCDEIKNGKRVQVAPLMSIDKFNLDRNDKYDSSHTMYEHFTTSGGSSNLPELLENKVKSLQYRTIRYLGHRDIVRSFQNLGFFSHDVPVGMHDSPREMLEKLLELNAKNKTQEDIVVARASLYSGVNRAQAHWKSYDIFCKSDVVSGFTAMAQTTGYSAAIVAQMIADGTVKQRGVVCGEEVIDGDEFIKRLQSTGIEIKCKI